MIKVTALIFMETDDPEHACTMLNLGMAEQLAGFPAGEIVSVDVEHFEEVTAEELQERGLTE